MEYATRHLYFPYTHEPLGECVYDENRSDKWHVPRYPTRKHTSETLQNFYKKRFMKILENLWQSSETFGKLRKQFKSVFQYFNDFLKFSANLLKFSENFGNGSKVIFRCFYDFLKIRENLRKSSENFQKTSETVQK